MVHIKLVNFMKYHDAEFKIKTGAINLIKGPSGAGKTTIIKAIQWCLFGTLRKVASDDAPKHRSSVTLTFEQKTQTITVYRQRNPGLVKLIIRGTTTLEFQDESAESQIRQLFGTEQQWMYGSYVKQKHLNEFLNDSSDKRGQFLASASFDQYDQDEVTRIINMISDASKKCEAELAVLRAQYLQQYADYTSWTANLHYQPITQDEHINNQLKKNELELNIRTAEAQTLKYKQSAVERKYVTDELAKTTAELNSVNVVEVDTSKLELERQMIHNAQYVESTRADLLSKRTNLTNSLQQYASCSVIDAQQLPAAEHFLETSREQFRRREIYAARAAEAGVDYPQVEAEKTRLNQLIMLNPQLEAAQKYYKERDELAAMHVTEPADPTPLQERLRMMTQAVKPLTCPHCQQPVNVVGGNLQKATQVQVYSAQEITELATQIQQLVQKRDAYFSYLQRRKYFETLPVPTVTGQPITTYELMKYKEKLNKINSIIYVEPVDKAKIDEYERSVQKTKLTVQLQKVESQLADLPSADVAVNQQRLAEINKLMSDYNLTKSKQRVLTDTITRLKTRLAAIPELTDPEPQLIEYRQQVAQLTQVITAGGNYLELQRRYEDLNAKCIKVTQLEKDVLTYAKLVEIASLLECERLGEVADSINRILEYIVPSLFENEINVTIRTTRTVGTGNNGRLKPEINVGLSRRGIDLKSIDQLSGGESDRVSFALSIAFNNYLNSDLLLFDETFESFDQSLKDAAVDIIKKMSPHKSTAVIMHDGVEGVFDNVIEVTP